MAVAIDQNDITLHYLHEDGDPEIQSLADLAQVGPVVDRQGLGEELAVDHVTLTETAETDVVRGFLGRCHADARAAGWWKAIDTTIVRTDGSPEQSVVSFGRLDLVEEVRANTFVGASEVAKKLALVHSEVSEALEGHRKGLMDDHLPHRPMVEVELADAIIRIMDLAGGLDLDVVGAIAEKLEYNRSRADHKIEARLAEGGKSY